jgi:Family of unknown function (DUF6334)
VIPVSLSDVVDSWGRVGSILALRSHRRVSALCLRFDSGECLVIQAVADDDTILLKNSSDLFDGWDDVSACPPLHDLVGRDLVWIWQLENQQGYQDGCQICVTADSVEYLVQFIVIASSLKVYSVTATQDLD